MREMINLLKGHIGAIGICFAGIALSLVMLPTEQAIPTVLVRDTTPALSNTTLTSDTLPTFTATTSSLATLPTATTSSTGTLSSLVTAVCPKGYVQYRPNVWGCAK